jgi:hypothetical protein
MAEKNHLPSPEALSPTSLTEGKSGDEKRYAISRVRSTPIIGEHAEAIDDKSPENHGDTTAKQLEASLARLEKLSQVMFSKALKGDLVAVGLAVEIEKSRAQLLEFDARERRAASESGRLEEEEPRPRQGSDSDLRGSSAEEPGRRERITLSRIPKIK